MKEYSKKCKENIDDTKKRVAFALYSSIVEKTPVDTGRARGNWHITVGGQSYEVFDNEAKTDSSVNTMITNGLSQISGSGDKSIFIQNNVEYIVPLEYGKSKQAPNGMVGITVANMQRYIDEAIRK